MRLRLSKEEDNIPPEQSIEQVMKNRATPIYPPGQAQSQLKKEHTGTKMTMQQDLINQVSLADRENYYLRKQIDDKQHELELVNYKHAKAQAKYIEIMRELSRFRDDFNDEYSIRSKILKVRDVTDQIEDILNIKEYRLGSFKNKRTNFSSPHRLIYPKRHSSPLPMVQSKE